MSLILASMPALGSHQHINAGALGSQAGAPLSFVNGDRFVAESGYVMPMQPATAGPRAGLHAGSVTFTALPAGLDYGGPAFGHAAPGSRLELVVETVVGPAGGRFGFWETAGESEGTELTFEVPVGETDGSHRFPLSESFGASGDDPYGHIHGRVFTVDLPGLYRVGMRLIDTSVNGADGGPLHPPSERYVFQLQAGVTLAWIEVGENTVQIAFGALARSVYQVERADRLGDPGAWSPVGAPVQGTDRLETVTVPLEAGPRFFRLRRTSV